MSARAILAVVFVSETNDAKHGTHTVHDDEKAKKTESIFFSRFFLLLRKLF